MKKNKLLCIVGETARGKDTAARYMESSLGLRGVVSYTTRPMREGETEGVEHYFITQEQAEEILKTSNIIAFTQIGEYIYFATEEEVDAADYYIIDPNGLKTLKERYNRELFILYITCNDVLASRRAFYRGDTLNVFLIRKFAEEKQFKDFAKNKEYDYIINNDYTIEMMYQQLDLIGQIIKNN